MPCICIDKQGHKLTEQSRKSKLTKTFWVFRDVLFVKHSSAVVIEQSVPVIISFATWIVIQVILLELKRTWGRKYPGLFMKEKFFWSCVSRRFLLPSSGFSQIGRILCRILYAIDHSLSAVHIWHQMALLCTRICCYVYRYRLMIKVFAVLCNYTCFAVIRSLRCGLYFCIISKV